MRTQEYIDLVNEQKIVVDIYTGATVRYHSHEFLELSYVLEGSANHTMEGMTTTLSKGDFFIIDYNKHHKYTQIGETPFTIMNCLFLPSLIDETLAGCEQLSEVVKNYLIKLDFYQVKDHPTNFIYHDEDGRIGRLFQQLHEEYVRKPMGYMETIRSYLILILIHIMRQIELPGTTKSGNEMIRHITDYVDKNYHEKLSLAKISQKYNYSLAHISTLFKTEMGVNFQEYVQSVRMKESCRLLINTSKKVSEIAAAVGYTDIKFFNEVFKRQIGMTPREFRGKYRT